ncbi:MAG: hypothetical protein Q7S40_01630 [Opitutaceae bacterium]|nr:hypothetical protein [Opitutaceae bacterium]
MSNSLSAGSLIFVAATANQGGAAPSNKTSQDIQPRMNANGREWPEAFGLYP